MPNKPSKPFDRTKELREVLASVMNEPPRPTRLGSFTFKATIRAVILKENDEFIAYSSLLNMTIRAKTQAQAEWRLQQAVEEFSKLPTKKLQKKFLKPFRPQSF